MSEFMHKYCVIPSRKTKNEAIKNNKPFEAGIAAIAERDCKKSENFLNGKNQPETFSLNFFIEISELYLKK